MVGLAACGTSTASAVKPTVPALPVPHVAFLYGDSITAEVRKEAAAEFPSNWAVKIRAGAGVPMCVIRDQVEQDRAKFHPTDISIQSFGATGACMTPAERVLDSPAYLARFGKDLRGAFRAARGAHVTYVDSPEVFTRKLARTQRDLRRIASEEAARAGVPVMGAPPLPRSVRSPDGVHFCPTGYANGAAFVAGCPVRSPGAERYARALARAVMLRGKGRA